MAKAEEMDQQWPPGPADHQEQVVPQTDVSLGRDFRTLWLHLLLRDVFLLLFF